MTKNSFETFQASSGDEDGDRKGDFLRNESAGMAWQYETKQLLKTKKLSLSFHLKGVKNCSKSDFKSYKKEQGTKPFHFKVLNVSTMLEA